MVLAIGPWQRRQEQSALIWVPPPEAFGSLDLRAPGHPSPENVGLFVFPGVVPIGYDVIGEYEDTLGLAARRALEDRFSIRRDAIQSTRLADILFEIMSDHRDPDGMTRHRGLIPDHRRRLELWINGHLVRGEPFDVSSPRWPAIRAQLRKERPDWHREVAAGRMSPRQLQKCLGFWAEKFKCDYTEFFAAGEKVIEPLPPSTTLPASPPETFSYSDGALGTVSSGAWTVVDGAYNVVSGKARTNSSTAGGGARCARYESNLSGGDQSAQVDSDDLGDTFGWAAPAVRFNSSSNEWYGAVMRRGSSPLRIWKRTVAGGVAEVSSTSGTTSQTQTCKLEVSGSNLTLYRNGVSVLGPSSDTSVPSTNVRAGIMGHSDADYTTDNWQAADLAAAVASFVFAPNPMAHMLVR